MAYILLHPKLSVCRERDTILCPTKSLFGWLKWIASLSFSLGCLRIRADPLSLSSTCQFKVERNFFSLHRNVSASAEIRKVRREGESAEFGYISGGQSEEPNFQLISATWWELDPDPPLAPTNTCWVHSKISPADQKWIPSWFITSFYLEQNANSQISYQLISWFVASSPLMNRMWIE